MDGKGHHAGVEVIAGRATYHEEMMKTRGRLEVSELQSGFRGELHAVLWRKGHCYRPLVQVASQLGEQSLVQEGRVVTAIAQLGKAGAYTCNLSNRSSQRGNEQDDMKSVRENIVA